MAKELVSPVALELYRKFDTQQNASRIHAEEEKKKIVRVKELFVQGVNILEEFGIAQEGFRGIRGLQEARGIKVNTPLVPLMIEGEEVNFVMVGFKPDYFLPEPPRPDHYEYISVNRVGEDARRFAVEAAYLFLIHAGEISTPLSKVTNQSEVIEAASSILDVMQLSLSETYPLRPRQVKSEPEKKGLVKAISRFNPMRVFDA